MGPPQRLTPTEYILLQNNQTTTITLRAARDYRYQKQVGYQGWESREKLDLQRQTPHCSWQGLPRATE